MQKLLTTLTTSVLALALGMSSARAQSLTWDPNLTGGTAPGGAGNWNLNTTGNWFNGVADQNWTDSSASGTAQAIFSGVTAGTVNLTSSLSASNLDFTTPGYTISGANVLTLGYGINATNLTSGTTTVSAPLELGSTEQLWVVGSGGTLAVNSTLTRSSGSSLDFTTPGITTSSANLANDASGIIGGWATVGDLTGGTAANWAANSGGSIVAYTGYTVVAASAALSTNGAGAATQNWITGAFGGANEVVTLTSSATINTIVQQGDVTLNSGVTLTLADGGLIESGISRWLLTSASAGGAFLTTGVPTGELFIHAPYPAPANSGSANNWRVWPQIIDNGGTPTILIKDGVGETMIANNSNSFTGGTIINAGVLVAADDNSGLRAGFGVTNAGTPFGTGPIVVNPGAELELGGSVGANNFKEFDIPNNVTLNGGIIYEDDAFQHVKGNLTIGPLGATFGSTYDADGDALLYREAKGLFLDGFLTGSGPITIRDSLISTNNTYNDSTVYFTNNGTAAQNTYSGTVTVIPSANSFASGGSYLYLAGTNAMANATINLTGDNSAATGRFGFSSLLFGSGSNLDGVEYGTIGGLSGTGDFMLQDTLTGTGGSYPASHTNGGPFALTVGLNNASTTYAAAMSGTGSLTKVGSGTLTLSGTNTYTGNTTVNGGTLLVTVSALKSANFTVTSGATLDESAVGGINLGASGTLINSGTVNGSVTTVSGSTVQTSTGGGYGTNTLNNNLSLASGAVVNFDVSTSHTGPNDVVDVGGTLTLNNNILNLSAPSSSVNLDTSDYTLFNVTGSISGSIIGINWVVAPLNANHYTVVVGSHTVTLHYTSTTAPTGAAAASPASLLRNQTTLLTVTATNGSGGSIVSVTVNASALGGSSSLALVNSGGNIWTNSVTVAANTAPGAYNLPAVMADTVPLTGLVNIPVTVSVTNDVWNGHGGNAFLDTAANWADGLAPGYVGDSMEFAGVTGLAPSVDNNYSITGLTFDAGAGSFSFSSGNGSTLTLTGTDTIANNSASTQTINVPVAGTTLTKIGTGAVVLAANNTYTGQTTVSAGTLSISGTLISSNANVVVGNTVTNSVLDVSGTLAVTNYMLVGNVSNANAAVYQTGGTVTVNSASGYDNLSVGNIQGAYGYYGATGGTLTANGICVAGENNNGSVSTFGSPGGNGIMEINGGAVNCTGWFVMERNNLAQTGELNVYSGSLTYAGGGLQVNWSAGQTSFINILGGNVATTALVPVGFRSAGTGVLNLNGGLLNGTAVNGGNGRVNFNGGTLQAATNSTAFIAVSSANVYSNGGTIDDNTFSLTNAQAILAPAGKGVYGIASFTGGAGYIAPPIVTITNGAGDTTGTGATALAQINTATGVVTNIMITCPGVNYTATPTFIVSGGGATTAATITGTAPVANTSGGMNFIGNGGSIALTGVNTYTGATTVGGNTLFLTGSGALTGTTNINLTILDTSELDVSGVTGGFVLNAGQEISGLGFINGNVTVAGSLAGGTAGGDGYGGCDYFDNVVLDAGGVISLSLGTSYSGANDSVSIGGTLTLTNNSIHLSAPSPSSSLDTTADYTLVTASGGITGTFAAAPIWDVRPVNAGHFAIVTGANSVTLHYNASVSSPTVTATANPTTLTANQTTKITAVVTPGSPGIVNGVTIDLTSLGGVVTSLVQSNSSTTWTNTITIPPSAPPGPASLNVTVTDSAAQSGSTAVALTISTVGEVWNGLGGNANWTTGANWIGGSAPAYSGDPLLFQGSTGTSPNMNTNYTLPSLTFSNNAGSFVIGSTTHSTLTLNTSGTNIVNNSASAEVLNVPIADANNGLDIVGGGGVTLGGSNIYTGSTLVASGIVSLTGSLESNTANSTIGTAAGNSEFNIAGDFAVTNYLVVGNVSGSVGAVYQTAGNVSVNAASGYDNLSLGNVPGSYGYYDAKGGTVTANGVAVAGEGNNGTTSSFGLAGNGVMDVNGGSVFCTGWLVIARNYNSTAGSEIGILNVYKGLLTYAGNGIVGPWDTGERANINIMGGVVSNTTATVGVLLGNTGFLGNLNLNGGVLEAGLVAGYNGPSYGAATAGLVSFNGGTLEASQANGTFVAVTSVYDYSGGATINNNGFTIGISNPLLAPTGNGVYGVASFTGGAGYIAPPIVTITNGAGDTTGSGATAIAQISPAGVVTNVLITCPGVNYTAVPVFTVTGGGPTTPATITGTAPSANSSGGLTAIGTGVTTLSGANTYTGNTTVSNGTLELASSTLNTNSTVTVATNAILQLDSATTNRVAFLVLNGTNEPVGLYNSTTGAPYITGAGTLQVTGVVAAPQPTITGVSISGTNIVFTGIHGLAGENYNILTSTNVAAPLSTWTVLPTGTFSSGNFTISNGVSTNLPRSFYIIRVP